MVGSSDASTTSSAAQLNNTTNTNGHQNNTQQHSPMKGGGQAQQPDPGKPYMPSHESPSNNNKTLEDNAPQPLDHFKRGYNERAEFREREVVEQQQQQGEDQKGYPSGNINSTSGDQTYHQRQQPGPSSIISDRNNNEITQQSSSQTHQPPNNYHNGPTTSNNYTGDNHPQQQRSHNNIYSKYEDKQYTRNSGLSDGYTNDRHHRPYNNYNNNNNNNYRYNNNNKGNNPGFSMEEVVDRLCHPRANVFEEMDHARNTSPESFHSGRAITAILSQLGRRRQMRVAMQVWRWMGSTSGITRNVFHYNALINVCEKIKDWRGALDLLRQMDEENVPKNEITYSSAISPCEKGGNWRTALDLLKTMKQKSIMPTAIAYNAGCDFFFIVVYFLLHYCVHCILIQWSVIPIHPQQPYLRVRR